MREPTLQSLIKKHKKRIKLLQNGVVDGDVSDYYPDVQAYYDWVEITKRYLKLHFPGDETAEEFCKLSEESFSIEQQHGLLAKLNAIAALPAIIPCENSVRTNRKKYEKLIVKLLELARICKRIVQIIWI